MIEFINNQKSKTKTKNEPVRFAISAIKIGVIKSVLEQLTVVLLVSL